ncbi:WD40 repeat-containing protein [Heterostelium album PN500]|uniref:WD40 repeat-containing protein n=1 Tax=Heterostelium pallidum (strain ATCC 26659 / Pp 5 / PN500) TaxID=670386 RepID=D3BL64_HETP5|nr:WD40 repeat-containing protein [Heterostelium album PN500]EFA77798.1 WD40 repeat-containing protein [Heterostelium album PN500]|eukprot:XP_020429926.1 WD40 repeat-containing protein [Heterostelium album PN500]
MSDKVVLMCNYGFRDITLNLIKSIENQYDQTDQFKSEWHDKFMFFALDDRASQFFQSKSIEAINLSNRSVINKCFNHYKTFIGYCNQCKRSICSDCHPVGQHTDIPDTNNLHLRDQYNNAMNSIAKEAVERPMTSVNDMMSMFGGSAGGSGNTIASNDTVYGEEAESYGNVGFRAICNEKPLVVLDVLKRGYNVLWTDTDIVWLGEPFAAFKHATQESGIDYDSLDLIVQQDDDDICAGFYYIRSNEVTIKYMETVIAFLNPIVDDQISMRKFLKEHAIQITKNNNNSSGVDTPSGNKLRYFRLPRTTFPNGTAYFNLKIPQRNNVKPVIVHNNCIIGHRSKRERFIEYNLWFIDDNKELNITTTTATTPTTKPKIAATGLFKAHFDVITSITKDEKNNLLYTASLDKSVKQWDCNNGNKLLKSKYVHKRGSIWGMYVNPSHSANSTAIPTSNNARDNIVLITASHDKTVQCWDKDMNSIQTHGGHYGIINGLLVINNDLLVTWSDDRTIRVASVKDTDYKRVFLGHTEPVSSVCYFMNRLFSASSDGTIRQWDFTTGRCTNIIHSHQGWVRSIVYDITKNQLISGGSDGSIKFWNLNTSECTKIIYPNIDDSSNNVSISQIILVNNILYVASENGSLKSYDINVCI